MKTFFAKIMMAAFMLSITPAVAGAQGFLDKISNALDKGTKALDKGLNTLDAIVPSDSAQQTSAVSSDSAVAIREKLLNDVPSYTVMKVIETDENGKQLTNEDGTVRYHYLVIDSQGKVCDAETAKSMVKSRLKAYGNILLKVGGGAVLGGLKGIINKNAKQALSGAAVGALAGLGLSSQDMKKIKSLNKSLKALDATLEAYQETFTDEGLPRDPSADLSDVNGIDFTKSDEMTKSAADVKAELEASKAAVASLDELDF